MPCCLKLSRRKQEKMESSEGPYRNQVSLNTSGDAEDDDISTASSDDDESTRRRSSITEKRLLSFYEHQLEESEEVVVQRKPAEEVLDILFKPHSYPCRDTHRTLPSPPKHWPQQYVMWRPTPHTSTVIRGIRYADASPGEYQHFEGFCAGCLLPINTGRESKGRSLVVDFESHHFDGTILLRVKDVPPTNKQQELTETSYFDQKKRTFQCLVKGKFKTALKMSECVTGQTFQRPAGKLPARWIVTSFIRVISALAPQLEASVDSKRPRFLTPLAATAQSVVVRESDESNGDDIVDDPATAAQIEPKDQAKLYNIQIYRGAHDMEEPVEEPIASDHCSLLQTLESSSTQHHEHKSISRRQKARKKEFNHVFAKHLDEPSFDTSKEYTYEFYQHLLLFREDKLVLDTLCGQVDLTPILNGQPIQIMAAHKDRDSGELDTLWSFDLWHESLYELAVKAESRS